MISVAIFGTEFIDRWFFLCMIITIYPTLVYRTVNLFSYCFHSCRLGSKSPYPTSPATQVDDNATMNLSNNASSGLGCFKQSVVAQEQIEPSSAA